MGAPGAEDGCQRRLALGTTFRPGAPADLAADNQMAQAALGRVVVRWHFGFGHEDEEFPVSSTGQALDAALDASAQLGLSCRRVVPEGLAEGQQLSFQGQLGGAPPLGLGMSAGFGSVVNPVDGVGPPVQWRSIGVEGVRWSWMSRSRWAQQRCLGPS